MAIGYSIDGLSNSIGNSKPFIDYEFHNLLIPVQDFDRQVIFNKFGLQIIIIS